MIHDMLVSTCLVSLLQTQASRVCVKNDFEKAFGLRRSRACCCSSMLAALFLLILVSHGLSAHKAYTIAASPAKSLPFTTLTLIRSIGNNYESLPRP
jgi:hypothetical protein